MQKVLIMGDIGSFVSLYKYIPQFWVSKGTEGGRCYIMKLLEIFRTLSPISSQKLFEFIQR